MRAGTKGVAGYYFHANSVLLFRSSCQEERLLFLTAVSLFRARLGSAPSGFPLSLGLLRENSAERGKDARKRISPNREPATYGSMLLR